MKFLVDVDTDTEVSWPLGTEDLVDVVLTVTEPDGDTSTPTVTETSGTYTATVATTLPGRYRLRWVSNAGNVTYSDVLNVLPADPRMLVSIPEAKNVLGLRTDTTDDDELLRLLLATVTVILEDIAGPLITVNRTQYASGPRAGVNLHHRPSGIVSVQENGATLTAETGYVFDEEAAIIWAGTRTAPRHFLPGRLNIRVEYTVGSNVLSPNIRLAADTLARHLWGLLSSHHNVYQTGDDNTEMTQTVSGYLVPRIVVALCQPQDRLPGISG